MSREVDKLKDDQKYEALIELMYFCEEGDILTGKQIKESIPFDVSPNQGIEEFFKEV